MSTSTSPQLHGFHVDDAGSKHGRRTTVVVVLVNDDAPGMMRALLSGP